MQKGEVPTRTGISTTGYQVDARETENTAVDKVNALVYNSRNCTGHEINYIEDGPVQKRDCFVLSPSQDQDPSYHHKPSFSLARQVLLLGFNNSYKALLISLQSLSAVIDHGD